MQRTLIMVALVVVLALAAYGQGGMGSIEGRVLDPAGAVVPSVTLKAVNVATQVVYTAVSNEIGNYVLLRLQPGNYVMTVDHPGFKKLERTNILVQVGDRLTIDVALQLGASSEVVSVTAEAPLVRAEDAQTGEVINNKMIQDLPQLNRDPFALIRLSGNVQGTGDRAAAGMTLRINGGRTQGIEYFVDGVTVGTGMAHDVSYNTPDHRGGCRVPGRSRTESRPSTAGFRAARWKWSPRAAPTRFTARCFEYVKNRVFNANTWLNNRNGADKGIFQENTYGGAVGGPVYHSEGLQRQG